MAENAKETYPQTTRILAIDDSGISRGQITTALRKLGFQDILVAASAIEAQALLQGPEIQTKPIHLIFCDIHMPEVTGLLFLRWLRAQKKFNLLPVIMLTASTATEEILEAASHGISNYMLKPFAAPVLIDKLASSWLKHGKTYRQSLEK